jgi:hypothetical protein
MRRNAKNKLNTNYVYLAESLGAQVHLLHEVHQLTPLDGTGSKSTPATRSGEDPHLGSVA